MNDSTYWLVVSAMVIAIFALAWVLVGIIVAWNDPAEVEVYFD